MLFKTLFSLYHYRLLTLKPLANANYSFFKKGGSLHKSHYNVVFPPGIQESLTIALGGIFPLTGFSSVFYLGDKLKQNRKVRCLSLLVRKSALAKLIGGNSTGGLKLGFLEFREEIQHQRDIRGGGGSFDVVVLLFFCSKYSTRFQKKCCKSQSHDDANTCKVSQLLSVQNTFT